MIPGLPHTFDQPSFWHERLKVEARPPIDGSERCDVAVVGGGMAGCAAALELAEAGMSVAVLEAGVVAGAATGRNAGFVLEGVAESHARTVELWGRERASRARRFTVANHDRIADHVSRFGIDCDYRRAGSIHLAATEREFAELSEGTAFLLRDGFQASIVSPDELAPWARAAGYVGGQRIPLDGELDPVAFGRGLAMAVERLGGRIWEGSAVGALAEDGDDLVLRCAGGELRAAAVVVATNAYGNLLVPWLRDRVDPVRGQMLALESIDERVFDVPIYASHGYEYWRQLPSGEVVLGGWRNLDMDAEVGHDHVLHGGIQDAMTRFIRGVHPALAGAEVRHRWSGIMGFSRDGLPIVGPLPGSPRVILCAGFTGHGFGFAVESGRLVRDLIVDGHSPWADLFDPRRLA